MARKEDPRVTDLARYRRAREQARRRPPPPPRQQAPNASFLGPRKNAGLILALVLLVLLALTVGPTFL
ncbi:hypothetical protein [Phenylobacterium sp.]|uniref:hypothetical protein n=1 Tax=Phenylobacterium sp. TaxID=1871053 RepID=UPI002F95C9F4